MSREEEKEKVFYIEDESRKIIAVMPNGDRYACTLACCPNPVCKCGKVNITFSPLELVDLDKPKHSYQVEVDVIEHKLASSEKKQASGENTKFGKLLVAGMNEADFHFLYQRYYAEKSEKTEKASVDSINAVFDFDQVEYDGLMYAYNDVLPYGKYLQVRMEDVDYVAIDQYCLVPKCSCTDSTLSFFLADESIEPATEQFSIEVNYKKKQWGESRGDKSITIFKKIKSAVAEQIPDFFNRLSRRHKRLKAIYAHCKQKHYVVQPQSLPTKVGRNDPCPCGSGKKYKKCCFRKADRQNIL